MEIEEFEFQYSPEVPLRAWRLFRVRRKGDGLVLSAPMYHDPDHPLWPNPVHEASCTEGHAAPAPGCRCGIYGAVAGTADSLPGYVVDTAYETDPWLYAEIGCSGRVFVDMRGVRAERGELLRLALPPAELGVHPAGDEAPSGTHQLLLMCRDLEQTVADLRQRGAEFADEISDEGFGRLINLKVPGADVIGLYEPKHKSPLVEFG